MANWKPMVAVCGAAFMLAFLTIPQVAQAGFFEQLFGSPQPDYQSQRGYEGGGFFAPGHTMRRLHRSHRVADEKPERQTPTDIMHDKTLRPGDAYMTASGLRIFTGEIGEIHDESDFTPLSDVHFLKKSERLQLAELNTAHDALPTEAARPVVRRSAYRSLHKPAVIEKEQAALSAAVRYVGP